MLFPKRQDFLTADTGLSLGASVTKKIPREFMLESLIVRVSVTVSGVMATANADAIQNILKRVRLTASDGARTRTIVDCSGAGLLEWQANVAQNSLDTNTSVGGNSATTYQIDYPVNFAPPNMADPIASNLLLPLNRFNDDPSLELQFASQADMDTNAAKTFAVSALSARVILNKRFVGLKNWPTFDTELIEATTAFSTDAANQEVELPSPGSYTGLLLRGYLDTDTRGDISQTDGEFKIQLLGVNNRRFRLDDIEQENYFSRNPNAGTAGIFTGSYYVDFLSDKVGATSPDFGSVLDVNLAVATGARLKLIGDIAGGTDVLLKHVRHRVFGNLGPLKSVNRLSAKRPR